MGGALHNQCVETAFYKHVVVCMYHVAVQFCAYYTVHSLLFPFSFSAAVYELLKKKSRLFSFGSNNAFLEFFLEGVPGILQTHVDSKKVRIR